MGVEMIEFEKAKRILQDQKKKYEAIIEELKEQIGHDNTPSFKSRRNYQIQLSKLIESKGCSLSRKNVKDLVGCGDERSQALQADLCEQGHAVRVGNRVKWA